MWAGHTELVFTDENNNSFLVDSQKLSLGENKRILFSNRIRRFGCNKDITAEEREIIVSKVLTLTPEIKWQIQ